MVRLKALVTSKIADLISLIKIKDATAQRLTLIAKSEQKKAKQMKSDNNKLRSKLKKIKQDKKERHNIIMLDSIDFPSGDRAPRKKEDDMKYRSKNTEEDFSFQTEYAKDLQSVLKNRELELSELKGKFKHVRRKNSILKKSLNDLQADNDFLETELGKIKLYSLN